VKVTDGNKGTGRTITNGNTTQELLNDLEARGYKLSVAENGKLRTASDGPPITPVIWHALQANYGKLVNLLRPPVTDTNSLPVATIRKDNTDWSRVTDLMPVRGEELERVVAEYAEAYQAASAVVNATAPKDFVDGMRMHWTEMNKRRSGRDHEAKRRVEASKKGGACGKCGGALKDGEAAYAGCRVYAGMGGGLMSRPGPRYDKAPVCKACAPEWLSEPRAYNEYTIGDRRVRIPASQRVDERPCSTCERPVVFEITRRKRSERVFCSPRCQYTFHNRRRSRRDESLRQKVCEVCAGEFTATRAHAKTCSAACKQKAYRSRKAINVEGGNA
jgi:hypothetical protein